MSNSVGHSGRTFSVGHLFHRKRQVVSRTQTTKKIFFFCHGNFLGYCFFCSFNDYIFSLYNFPMCAQLCLTLCDPTRLLCPWDFLGFGYIYSWIKDTVLFMVAEGKG